MFYVYIYVFSDYIACNMFVVLRSCLCIHEYIACSCPM